LGKNTGRNGQICTNNELDLGTQLHCKVSSKSSEKFRIATVVKATDRQTDKSNFILCPLLYAIALREIKDYVTAYLSSS